LDEKTAWEQFFHSGAVQDYLSYRAAAENTAQVPQGGNIHADQYGRPDHTGAEHR